MDLLLKVHLENPSSLSLSDINDEVNTFIAAGHDTTAAAVQWASYLIARHSDVQKKIQEELNERIGKYFFFDKFVHRFLVIFILGTTNRSLTIEDLGKLKYLDCVFKETLIRLFPIGSFMIREITEDTNIGL